MVMDAAGNTMPQSVEEAGALLGAAITRYGKGAYAVTNPPKGIPSSFAVVSPVPSSELLDLLHTLRSLLRSAPRDTPLVAAPSLLAGVLMKLLGISSSLASSANLSKSDAKADVPPMLSTAIRRVWVDCVVLCHSLGEGLSGAQRINLYGFVRDMILLAGLNPRTARALGGTRIAALEVISGVLEDKKLSSQMASWALDVAQLCQRALKSSGSGEPTYRIAAIKAACSVAVAARTSFLKTRDISESGQFVLKGALEDKAIFEMVKVLKIAVQDKYPEVRSAAARLACLLGPLAINLHIKSPSSPDAQATSPTSCLEEIMTLAFKNLDDESAHVMEGWAEALARCMCTSIELKNQEGSERDRDSENGSSSAPETPTGRGGKKGMLSADVCSTLPNAIKYLVSVFIKVGGELAAPRAGGTYSTGGRAIRVGFARTIIHLLRLQLQIQSIGEGRSLSFKESILVILAMVGSEMEAQLNPQDRGSSPMNYLDATTVVTSRYSCSSGTSIIPSSQTGRNLFGSGPKVSHADGCMARVLTSRVIRDGLSEQMTENSQLALLHLLLDLCTNKQNALKGNQLQVVLVEISHLFATLGEASASSLEEGVPGILKCLRHPDHGVRYEAAVVCASITSVFPSEGRKILMTCISQVRVEHAELMSVASTGGIPDSKAEVTTPRFRFGRTTPTKKGGKVDETLKHQYAIHGMSLATSFLVRDLPELPGGLSTTSLESVVSLCESLISTSSNDAIKNASPSSTCTCVRAGFSLISGVLTTGPDATCKQIVAIFGLWQKVCKSTQSSNRFTADHEMICIEAMLTSVVTFLKFCSELLLSIPDALSRLSLLLENLLPLFFSKGRLGATPVNPAAACRLDSAKSSLMEAFAWLPPGSFPMIADSVFGFAASNIQSAIQNDVKCSILPSLLSKEDMILDAVSLDRATKFGQVGGAQDLGRDIVALSSEVAHHGDRESAFAFLGKQHPKKKHDESFFLESKVLGLLEFERKDKPITVLHQVGTWRRPIDPSCATRVRLVDAAVEAFASTFALCSGKEQQKAMDILQSLLPPTHLQSGRNSGSADLDRAGKLRDSSNTASETNIVAVILSCVKALPVDESTHDIPVGLGPSWKNKAANILLATLSSSESDIRRAAAEGLASLSTLGVKEDMRFLQSSVLHSLDEVISRNPGQNQGRNIPLDEYQHGRSSGLLALACIRRSTHRITARRAIRSRLRGSPRRSKEEEEDSLPTIQIMMRMLPYVVGQVSSDIALNARTSALHSILMLLEYSGKMNHHHLVGEDLHLLKKAVEIVEGNYLSAWTVASYSLDRGTETLKITYEAAFLSVLLRFMTFLTPLLHHLEDTDPGIARRFSTMAMIITECFRDHSVVQIEALAFFEVLASNQDLLPEHGGGINYDENPILSCIPLLMSNLRPHRSKVLSHGFSDVLYGCHSSSTCLRATLRVLYALSHSKILVAEWSDMKAISVLLASLESSISRSNFSGESFDRGLAVPRAAEDSYKGFNLFTKEVSAVLRSLLYLERDSSHMFELMMLRYILLSRSILSGIATLKDEEDEDEDNIHTIASVTKEALGKASADSGSLFAISNVARWQVKSIVAHLMAVAIEELSTKCKNSGLKLQESFQFNPKLAQKEILKACHAANASDSKSPESVLALHVPEIVSTACAVATATVDQVELRILQENAMYCITSLIDSFASIQDPNEIDSSILSDYIPQISSCIKSSLSAPDENVNDLTSRLFWSGCLTLHSFIESKITDDTAVLKRLIRPVMLTIGEVPFFGVESPMPTSNHGTEDEGHNSTLGSTLLLKIGKIWMLGNIPKEPEISKMIEASSSSIGVHAAALAIDGANLLRISKLNLCGNLSEKKRSREEKSCDFFSFHTVRDIDDYSKAALTRTWASNAQLSIQLLMEVANSDEFSDTESKSCLEWLDRIIPFVFLGLYDAIETIASKVSNRESRDWAAQVDSCDVACCCLKALRTIAVSSNLAHLKEQWRYEIEKSTDRIFRLILLPILQGNKPSKSSEGHSEEKLVANTCDLLKTFSASLVLEKNTGSCQFLGTLLRPLDLLEKKQINIDNDLSATIVASCLNSVAGMVASNVHPALAKVMLPLASSLSLSVNDKVSESVALASQALLERCLIDESTSTAELSMITSKLAKSRNWKGWLSVVNIREGMAIEESLMELETSLLNPGDIKEQLSALAALRDLIQQYPPPNPLTGRILSAIGGEVFSVFQAYGTLSNPSAELQSQRLNACADSMKVSLACYQQCSSDFSEEEAKGFLLLFFPILISILRFNGLPNHPPPQGTLSNPSIGRMCAQTITHVARTTPIPFKASMGGMSDHDRAVLEFAVRGEMSGYAVASAPAPSKKKLSLKGFKK